MPHSLEVDMASDLPVVLNMLIFLHYFHVAHLLLLRLLGGKTRRSLIFRLVPKEAPCELKHSHAVGHQNSLTEGLFEYILRLLAIQLGLFQSILKLQKD